MPKTDPVTGCRVMTRAEFWHSEAEREGTGRDPWELQEEMFDALEEDSRNVEDELRKDALKLLREPILHSDDAPYKSSLAVKDIVEIISVDHSQSFSECSSNLIAKVRLHSGEEVTAHWSQWESSGSFYEPPCGDSRVTIVREEAAND